DYHCAAPGGSRNLFADFLDEASVLLEEPLLSDAGEQYRELGERWQEVAHAALPDNVPLFEDTRILLRKKQDLWHEQGRDAEEQILRLTQDLKMLAQEAREAFPLDNAAQLDLLRGLGERLQELHRIETEAAQAMTDLLETLRDTIVGKS
ncbi:DUF4872 domain-containing protein, partial [bacterium]|nr:DUF4872 domain-containing protein [bacterium]